VLDVTLLARARTALEHAPIYACPPDWAYEQRVAAARRVRAAIEDVKIAVDATVGEQGIFRPHAHWFERHYGSAAVNTIAAIKTALDPHAVLNPARFDVSR
jgi:FAD/FMN-containing dehydrogenase